MSGKSVIRSLVLLAFVGAAVAASQYLGALIATLG